MNLKINEDVLAKIEEAAGVTKKVLGLHADEQAMDVEVGIADHTFNSKAVVCVVVTDQPEKRLFLVLTKVIPVQQLVEFHGQLKRLGWLEDRQKNVKDVFAQYDDKMPSWVLSF